MFTIEQHHVYTDDEQKLSLERFKGGNMSVILIHGGGGNSHLMSLDSEQGLAQILASEGYDAWCINLRGRTKAATPDYAWPFDDYFHYDLPAALDYINEFNKNKINWIGHSMGGVLFFALSSHYPEYRHVIGRAVTLGSSGAWPMSPQSYATQLWLPFLPKRIGGDYLFNQSPNIIKDIVSSTVGNLTDYMFGYHEDMPRGFTPPSKKVLVQYIEWLGGYSNLNKLIDPFDVHKNNLKAAAPTLMIAGGSDHVIPPARVKRTYDYIQGPHQFEVASRENNYDQNYDHLDLIQAKKGHNTIINTIIDWLE